MTRFTSLALLFAAALMLLPLGGHVDDSDDQLYRVVARHLVQDHAWLPLRYLPNVHPQFREHLPFGLWPQRLAAPLGQAGAHVPGLLFSLLLLGWVAVTGTRGAGAISGNAALLILATTETLFTYAATARLDAPLLWLAWAGATPFLWPRPARVLWPLAALFTALAIAVKGPFGLVPLVAAATVRALQGRSVVPLLAGAGMGVLALLPVAAFLLHARLHGDATWWTGYVQGQLWASARGARADGSFRSVLYPFQVVLHRFWPGLLLLPLGVWAALRGPFPAREAARTFGLLSLLTLAALCVPGRKVWNHSLIAFPPLALFAGAGVGALAAQLALGAGAGRRAFIAVGAATLLVCAASVLGVGARLWPPNCLAQGPLAAQWSALPPTARLAIVTPTPAWGVLSSLAAERSLEPLLFASTEEALTARPPVSVLLVRDSPDPPAGWVRQGTRGPWTLFRMHPEDP